MRYILLLISFFLAYSIVLAGDFADAKKKYADIPKEEKEPWENWIEPYDETFLPFTVCSEPKSLKVVGLKEKVDSSIGSDSDVNLGFSAVYGVCYNDK